MQRSTEKHRGHGLGLAVHRFRDPEAAPSGVTMLLLHGFLDAGSTWDLVAPALTRAGHDVVAPDLRGFGDSDRVGAGGYYHFPDYVADVAALVDALAPARLVVVGHSMGGTLAGLFAGTWPERVERLALLEGLGPLATEPALAPDRMQAWLRDLARIERSPRALGGLEDATARLVAQHPRVPREILATRAALLSRRLEDGSLVWRFDPLHRSTSPLPFQPAVFRAFLSRIRCPTLLVSGGPTGFHAPDEPERAAAMPHAVHVELADAGHMMHWTAPEALGAALLELVAG